MLRTSSRRSRGRPFGPPPVFLGDCQRFDATALLAKSRGARFSGAESGAAGRPGQWTLQWTEDGRTQYRTVALPVTTTRQHFGGIRRWWRCPLCGRRCRVLVAVAPEAPIACRVCLNTRYASDYPARDRRRRFVGLFHALGRGGLDADDQREMDFLLAPRRRGIRRGRRVRLRAARSLMRLQARLEAVPSILQIGGL